MRSIVFVGGRRLVTILSYNLEISPVRQELCTTYNHGNHRTLPVSLPGDHTISNYVSAWILGAPRPFYRG